MIEVGVQLNQQHVCLQVSGQVQGVGFRPFVYQLAQSLELKGSVYNSSQGVKINLQGDVTSVEKFQQKLKKCLPKQAVIEKVSSENLPLANYQNFEIIHSQIDSSASYTQKIPSDIALCETCLTEFKDPNNRRYHDAFINCSDCGPRYSILQQLPYDRQRSAMQVYTMCENCLSEYKTPSNRRFHTQGICCPDCGPKIRLYSANKTLIAENTEALQKVAQILKQAGLVAFKGVGGFHILCDANNDEAVKKLRLGKNRAEKPFAVLCADLAMAQKLATPSEHEIDLLNCDAKPIVLLDKKPNSELSDLVAPNINKLGIFLAYTPLLQLLFEFFDRPLIATSANLSGEPILYQFEEVFNKLCGPDKELVDLVLDYDRDIINPCDDSIMQSINGKPMVLRLARGLAPYYQTLSDDSVNIKQTILALGAQQKNTIAYAYEKQILLSPYCADLGSIASHQRFQKNVQQFSELHKLTPNKVVSDLHPDYLTSQWASYYAKKKQIQHQTIQHHYAHALACMAEFNLQEKVLAFCWDGTGLGDDQTIWGGEVLLADRESYQRVLFLKPFKLLGGDIAIQQPRRVALALLFEQYTLEQVLVLDSPTVKAFSSTEIEQLYLIQQKNLNSPLTSSIGRLFDAVASLLGIVQNLDYEGQSGLLLETLYDRNEISSYEFEINNSQIDTQPMIRHLLRDQQGGVQYSLIISRFFNSLLNIIEKIAELYQDLPVVVAGGVFQNKTLLTLVEQRFENKKRRFYFQQQTPINDGSIALGQLFSRTLFIEKS